MFCNVINSSKLLNWSTAESAYWPLDTITILLVFEALGNYLAHLTVGQTAIVNTRMFHYRVNHRQQRKYAELFQRLRMNIK